MAALLLLTIHVASGTGMLLELLQFGARRRIKDVMHVVIVDEELPYPPNSGKRIRTLNLSCRWLAAIE